MKRFGLAAIFAVITGFGAQAAVLDFETVPGGAPSTKLMGGSVGDHTPYLVNDIYAALGVTFSSEGDASGGDAHPIFGDLTGFAGANTVVQDYKRDSGASFNIRADFSLLQSFVVADVFAATGTTVTMTSYNALGAAIASATSGPLTIGTGSSLGLGGAMEISYVIWESSSPFASSVGIDNLSFTSPVPLPAGGALLLSAIGLLGLRRKKGH